MPEKSEKIIIEEPPVEESVTTDVVSNENVNEPVSVVTETETTQVTSDQVTAKPINEAKVPAQLFENDAVESVQSEGHHKWLLIILVLILLIVALAGGIFYYYTQFVSNPDGAFLSPVPGGTNLVVTTGEGEPSDGVDEMEQTSESDELEAIKGDIDGTNLSTVEADLDELEKSL